jgi:hypothetical protein
MLPLVHSLNGRFEVTTVEPCPLPNLTGKGRSRQPSVPTNPSTDGDRVHSLYEVYPVPLKQFIL